MSVLPTTPDLEEKIKVLMHEALPDLEQGDTQGKATRPRQALDPVNLKNLKTAFGSTKLFRILLTNACVFTCDYCPMRQGRKMRRLYVEPARLARVFMYAARRGWAEGLFVTSGIPKNPVWAMDKMIELVETVRLKYGFAGYIHAKALPGAETDQVIRLAGLVDRMSFNLEASCETALHQIAPQKSVAAGLRVLEAAAGVKAQADAQAADQSAGKSGSRVVRPVLKSGMTTQFVVTPDGAPDRDLLGLASSLYQKKILHHTHYAAFRPIFDTPMENQPAVPVERERRLYEADYLLRQYGFAAAEMPYGAGGNLPLGIDVKLAWALQHPELFPIELLTAPRETLLRIPGCGPRGIARLLACRVVSPPNGSRDLLKMGFALRRAIPFVTLRGRRLGPSRLQLPLFAGAEITPEKFLYSVSPGTFR